jgi:hypothetical protein
MEPLIEHMQTYFDIDNQGELQIVGKITRDVSNIAKVSLPDMGNGFISVCTKLGASYVDHKCRERGEVPCWTLSQIDNAVKEHMQRNSQLGHSAFMVVKDGFQFWFQKYVFGEGETQVQGGTPGQYYLDHIICKVKILPQKHKQVKNPLNFYGELVKTKVGTDYLRRSRHV